MCVLRGSGTACTAPLPGSLDPGTPSHGHPAISTLMLHVQMYGGPIVSNVGDALKGRAPLKVVRSAETRLVSEKG